MKKTLCIILALFTLLFVFGACGKQETKGETESSSEAWTPDPAAAEYYSNTVTQENGDTTTHRADKIYQDAHGVKVEMLSQDAKAGDLCSITVKGEANAEFSIEFYNDGANRLDVPDAGNVSSDENGTARWQFYMPSYAKSGAKAVVIRQVGTENYVRAVIFVK